MENQIYLVVGLGNPGKEYENTFHNVGFNALNFFANKNNVLLTKLKCKAQIYEGKLFDKKVILAKPLTFMNLSGQAVNELSQKYNVENKNILIIYDDFDLPIGEVRFRKSGSAGTHNGMKNIVENLGTENFSRIRVGINTETKIKIIDYVLSKVSEENKAVLQNAFENVSNLIKDFILKDGNIENVSIK